MIKNWLQKCLPREVSVGEPFVSEIRVTNLTGLALTDVVVTDTLPEGYELASTDPVTEAAAGGKLTWRFAKLEPGAGKVIKVTGKATKVGSLANCATVAYNTVLCVETKVVQPALALAKTLTPEALAENIVVSGVNQQHRADVAHPPPAVPIPRGLPFAARRFTAVGAKQDHVRFRRGECAHQAERSSAELQIKVLLTQQRAAGDKVYRIVQDRAGTECANRAADGACVGWHQGNRLVIKVVRRCGEVCRHRAPRPIEVG